MYSIMIRSRLIRTTRLDDVSKRNDIPLKMYELRRFQGGFREVSGRFQRGFRMVSGKFQAGLRKVSERFQGGFREVSEGFREVSVIRRSQGFR